MSRRVSPFYSYLLVILLLPTAILLIGVGVVWATNPYWMWRVPASFNLVDPTTPRPIPNQRLAKSWHISNKRPQGLILGSSRSEWGLDPTHPGWRVDNVYNASLAAAKLYEMGRYLEHAYNTHPIDQLVVSLDLSMFGPGEPDTAPNFDERYIVGGSASLWRHLQRWKPTISIDGWRDTQELISNNGEINTERTLFLANGQREQTYYWYKTIRPTGYRAAFERTTTILAAEFDERFADPRVSPEKIDHFRRILEFAYEHQIDLYVIISPVHGWTLEMFRIQGGQTIVEEWKRTIVEINAKTASTFDTTPAPVWDFADYNAFTMENVPPRGDRETQMRWHWEVNHYRAELGALILDRVFGTDTVSLPISDPGSIAEKENFGSLITPDNIDEHLRAVERHRAGYIDRLEEELRFLHDGT